MLIPSVYDVQAVELSTQAVFTNTAPTSVYRGAGRPEAIYLIERLIDRAAQVSGIDRVEIRRRNLIAPSALPYHTATHHNYDSGEFARVMDDCLDIAEWTGFEARRAVSRRNGKLRGRAVTPYIELGGVFNERMELRFDPSGMVSIVAGTHSHGQGHETAFAQLVSEWLGVPFEAIQYIQGDTAQVAFGRGTFAARSSMVGGVALRGAADAIIERAKGMAGALMEAAMNDIEFRNGKFTVVGTDKAIAMTDVAKAFYAPAGPVLRFGLGLEASGSYTGAPGGARGRFTAGLPRARAKPYGRMLPMTRRVSC
jgi:carbon-monoxide dehydrogenase large subunit